MSGWIKLHRQFTSWEWYDDNNTFKLFIHCLLRANHKDKKWRGIDIPRGSFYTSLDTLVSETKLSHRQIRTSFDKLKTTGEVTSLGMARGRMITVVQYDEYQGDDRLSVNEKAGWRQADDRVATTNKNDNKEKKVNNIDHPGDDRHKQPEIIQPAFDHFWKNYPRKIGKKKALARFVVLTKKKTDEEVRELVNMIGFDINNKISSYVWEPEEKIEFVPHPATYLNSEQWADHE